MLAWYEAAEHGDIVEYIVGHGTVNTSPSVHDITQGAKVRRSSHLATRSPFNENKHRTNDNAHTAARRHTPHHTAPYHSAGRACGPVTLLSRTRVQRKECVQHQVHAALPLRNTWLESAGDTKQVPSTWQSYRRADPGRTPPA